MKRVLAVLFTVILLAGCTQKPQPVEQTSPAPTPPAIEQKVEPTSLPAPKEKDGNLFDARKVKADDQVAGFRITKVEVHNASDEDYDAYVSFEGEVTVSGTFKHNLDDEFLDHEISFRVDDESVALLPMLAHDKRDVWFMFMNHDEAESSLGAPGKEGKATVTIKNYNIYYAHTEIWNTADLVKADKN